MFSARLRWDLRPNRLAESLAQRRAAGLEILDLTESNPTRAGLSYPAAEIAAAMSDPHGLVYEPAPAGLESAREAVAVHHGVAPERILLAASTSEAYAYLFKLLTDPGDEVLVPRPSYPLFEFLAELEAARVVQYPLLYQHGWSVDFEVLERAATTRARAIVVVNPNNPTGSFLKREELARLVEFAAARGIAIISDEVFADYWFAPDARRVATLAGVEDAACFCLSGLSKLCGLPQMKLSWIVLAGPAAWRARAAERLELIADTFLSVSTPVQHALPKLLEACAGVRGQIVRRVRDNLAFLRASVGADSPCRVLEVEGGWYATLRAPRVRSEEEWTLELLAGDGVLVQPGFFFDFEQEAFLVVSLLTEPGRFREGIRRLLARVTMVAS